jgi:hypothetical protein
MSSLKDVEWTFTGIDGKLVNATIQADGSLDTSYLPNGLYILQGVSNQVLLRKHFLIVH